MRDDLCFRFHLIRVINKTEHRPKKGDFERATALINDSTYCAALPLSPGKERPCSKHQMLANA